jgi:hypothetical protein
MLITLVDWACWIPALLAISSYVGALLRNRAYLRPMNSLGLLPVGGAVLDVPAIVGGTTPARPWVPASATALLVLLVSFQVVSAFRRRCARPVEAHA